MYLDLIFQSFIYYFLQVLNLFKNKFSLFFTRNQKLLIPHEFNFWIFLLIICQCAKVPSSLTSSSLLSCWINCTDNSFIIPFFCVFLCFILFLNLLFNLLKNLVQSQLKAIFICYLIALPFSFFTSLLFFGFLKSLPIRIIGGLVMLIITGIICYLIFKFSPVKEKENFLKFYKSCIPAILAFVVIFVSFYLLQWVSLHLAFIFFICYNFSFLQEFYNEDFKPKILRSSLIWNIFRFCTPAPLFLLEEGFVLAFPGLLGFLKVQPLIPKISGYERFLNLKPRLSWLPSGGHYQIARFFCSSSEADDLITKFIKKNLVILIEEIAKSKKQGFPSETLKAVFQEFPSEYTIKRFIMLPNFSTAEARELLHFFLWKNIFSQSFLVPASWFFNGYENLPAVHPKDLSKFSEVTEVLNEYFNIKKVDSPFIFKMEDLWFLALNSTKLIAFDEATITFLNDELTKKPEFWRHSFSRFSGSSLALFSLNDFLIFNEFALKFVQAKSSVKDSLFIRDTKTDFFSILNIKKQTFLIFANDSSYSLVHSEEIKVIKEQSSNEEYQKAVSKNLSQIESVLNDKNRLDEIRFSVAKEIISRGALPLKKDNGFLLELTKKNEDI